MIYNELEFRVQGLEFEVLGGISELSSSPWKLTNVKSPSPRKGSKGGMMVGGIVPK